MYAVTDELLSSIIDPEDEDVFKGYMQALQPYVVDSSDLDLDELTSTLTLWLHPNEDREECIRLFEEIFDTLCPGDIDYSKSNALVVTFDDPNVANYIYKYLL